MYMKYWLHSSDGTISFAWGWVTFGKYFTVKGASAINQYWCQKTRVIAGSCGIKISTVHCLVLSQDTHLTERQTDRQTDGRTELRQQYCALHYMQSHGKNHLYSQCQYIYVWSVNQLESRVRSMSVYPGGGTSLSFWTITSVTTLSETCHTQTHLHHDQASQDQHQPKSRHFKRKTGHWQAVQNSITLKMT